MFARTQGMRCGSLFLRPSHREEESVAHLR